MTDRNTDIVKAYRCRHFLLCFNILKLLITMKISAHENIILTNKTFFLAQFLIFLNKDFHHFFCVSNIMIQFHMKSGLNKQGSNNERSFNCKFLF